MATVVNQREVSLRSNPTRLTTVGVISYTATVYKAIASTSSPTIGEGSYNFNTNVLTPPTGWVITQPAESTTNVWASSYTFTTNTFGATVTGGSWSSPHILTSGLASTVANNLVIETAELSDNISQEVRDRINSVEETANSVLRNLLTQSNADTVINGSVASARNELTEFIVSGLSAEAASRQTLIAGLNTDLASTRALVLAESAARVSADIAEATSRDILSSQLRGAYTGSDLNAITTGLLYQERLARSTADSSLSQQITLLSAGAGEQFDWDKIWYFDSSTESWSGNGTPTFAAGYLRPANAVSDAYVVSPSSLDVDGNKYNQLRLRIRKIGSPVWDGFIYWKASTDSTWDTGRRVILTAPTWDVNGIGLVTATTTWTGLISQIRVDLSDAQTVTDYYELDWVAIGRPSPGASSAQLLEEQTARIDADTAISSSVTSLTTQLNDPTTGLAATRSTLLTDYYTESAADTATASAQTTLIAEYKSTNNRIFRSATPPTQSSSNIVLANGTSYSVNFLRDNDIWLDSDDGDKPHRWQTSAWIYSPDSSAAASTAYKNNLESAIATPTTATVASWSSAIAEVVDPITGLVNTRASLNSFQNQQAGVNAALVKDTRELVVSNGQTSEDILRNLLSGETNKNIGESTLALARTELQTNIDNGLLAEARERTNLASRVEDNTALIQSEISTRTSQYDATASAILDLQVQSSENTADILNEQIVRANETDALASSISLLGVEVGNNKTSIESTVSTVIDDVTGINSKFGVKIDVNGYVSGFGLISTANNATPTSEFTIVADKFSVAPVNTDNTVSDGSPFFHRTSSTTIDGVLVAAGTYLKSAFIHDAAITNAKIGNYIQSNNFDGTINSSGNITSPGSTGWAIGKAGNAVFQNIFVRGTIEADSFSNFAGDVNGSIGGTAVPTVLTNISDRLSKSSNTILGATISLSATPNAGLVAGTLQWNASGVRTSGSGVAITPGGILGHNGTNTTFSINASTGEAIFGGTLSAPSGTLGSLDVGSTGSIRGGQTDYNTSVGWWIGSSSGVPKFSIGDPNGSYMRWNGSSLEINTTALIATNPTIIGVKSSIDQADYATTGGGATASTSASYTRAGEGWYTGGSSTIGDGYWIRVTKKLATDSGPTTGSLGVWLQLSSSRNWTLSATNAIKVVSLIVEISTDSVGATVVASGEINLISESYSGAIP